MAKISGTLKDNQHSPYKYWADCELKQITEPVVAVGLYIASLLEEIITASNMCYGALMFFGKYVLSIPIRKPAQKQFIFS